MGRESGSIDACAYDATSYEVTAWTMPQASRALPLPHVDLATRGHELMGRGNAAHYRDRCHRRWQYLDRDVATELRIAGAMDLAHSAGADRSDNFIWADPIAGSERHAERARLYEVAAIQQDYSRVTPRVYQW